MHFINIVIIKKKTHRSLFPTFVLRKVRAVYLAVYFCVSMRPLCQTLTSIGRKSRFFSSPMFSGHPRPNKAPGKQRLPAASTWPQAPGLTFTFAKSLTCELWGDLLRYFEYIYIFFFNSDTAGGNPQR